MTATDETTMAVPPAVDPVLEDPREGWEDWEPTIPEDDGEAAHALEQSIAAADRAEAETMAERLAGIERQRAQVGSIYQAKIDDLYARIAAIEARAAEIDAPLALRAKYAKGWLQAYALRERARTKGRAKSVKFLHATVSTTETGGGWTVDTDEALPWLLTERPDLVDCRLVVKVAEAKRTPGWTVKDGLVVTGEGEIIPGIRVEQKTITARVALVDTGEA